MPHRLPHSSDRRDETWVLYNRELLDDEVRAALSGFVVGVRVVVVSDSCHSGTVVRDAAELLLHHRDVAAAYAKVAPHLRSRGRAQAKARAADATPKVREIPAAVQKRIEGKHGDMYGAIRRSTPRAEALTTDASILLLAACMDNQTSAEYNGHGLFTAALLEQWNGRTFAASYDEVMSSARKQLPSSQSPNTLKTGREWPSFEKQIAFTVAPPDDTTAPSPQMPGATATHPSDETTPVSSPHPTVVPSTGGVPELSLSIGVTLRPTDPISEMVLNLLAASLETTGTTNRRDLGTLVLDSLHCQTSDDYGGDEPIITFDGEQVWRASGVDSGDSRAIGYRRAFSDSVIVQLYDEEIGVDDDIGTRVITSDDAGLGARQAYFAGSGGARYTLTYHVE